MLSLPLHAQVYYLPLPLLLVNGSLIFYMTITNVMANG